MARSVLRCPHDAEEIVSEVFMFVWAKACRYDSRRGSVMGWINIITRHRAIDKIRKRRRTVSLDEGPGNPWLEAPTAESERPEYPLSQSQDARELHRVLDNLSPLRRQIMLLAFIQGHCHVKIAATTGLPLGTVKSHIRRTLKDMQSMLGAGICVTS
jgi:RNA polymerase sigma-70 factor (ECF subfamily)